MKKSLRLLPLIALIPVLSSCSLFGSQATTSSVPDITFKTIASNNISALVVSSLISDEEHFIITNNEQDTLDSFTNNEYEIIIGDIASGIQAIQFASSAYKLARVITTGNLYLVSTGNDTDNTPTSDDYIVGLDYSIDQSSISNTIFGLTPKYEASTSDELTQILKTGKQGNNDVDYVIIEEPYLNTVLKDESKTTNPTIVKSAKEVGGKPQYGVFIANSLANDADRTQALLLVLARIDQTLTDLALNGGIATISNLNKVGDSIAQISKFGIDATTLRELQYSSDSKQNQNRLGINSSYYDIKEYQSKNPNVAPTISTILDTTLSAYYYD